MASRQGAEEFLRDFIMKLSIWGIVYRDERSKNAQALLDLEITPAQRTEVIKNLTVTEYSEGPKKEKLYGGADMWIFGRRIKGHEVYIKVTMGIEGRQVICISFHVAEHHLEYPFKN